MHKTHAIAALAFAFALGAPAGGALAQEIERTVASPTAVISSNASLPPGSRIVFISGTTPPRSIQPYRRTSETPASRRCRS